MSENENDILASRFFQSRQDLVNTVRKVHGFSGLLGLCQITNGMQMMQTRNVVQNVFAVFLISGDTASVSHSRSIDQPDLKVRNTVLLHKHSHTIKLLP